MKRITTILVAAVLCITLLQCKKEKKDMDVYHLAVQSITFSEATDFIMVLQKESGYRYCDLISVRVVMSREAVV